MDTALYYTFSTISQTLAGAIALLGAFVLYRFQIQKENLREIGRRVSWSFGSGRTVLERFIEADQFERFLQECNQQKGTEPPNQSFKELFPKFNKEYELKSRLIPELKNVLKLTLGVIGYSVVILIVTPKIKDMDFLVGLIFLIRVLGFSACLVYFYRLVMKIITGSG